MPTSYTHPVKDGEVTTLSEYLKRCAQAYIIDMRDLPIGADIPMPSRWSLDYREEGLTAARKALAWYRTATDAQLREERDRKAGEWVTSVLDAQRKDAEDAARYDAMINQVQGWIAPAQLAGLRDFMLSQLVESKRLDTINWDSQREAARAAMHEPVEDYRTRHIQAAVRAVDREKQGLQEAQEHYDHNLSYRDILVGELARIQRQEAGREATAGA